MKRIFCFSNGWDRTSVEAVALCEDGHILAVRSATDENGVMSVLGVDRPYSDVHRAYDAHCGKDWRLVPVTDHDDPEFRGALALNQRLDEGENGDYTLTDGTRIRRVG